jgi:hypothetical protein
MAAALAAIVTVTTGAVAFATSVEQAQGCTTTLRGRLSYNPNNPVPHVYTGGGQATVDYSGTQGYAKHDSSAVNSWKTCVG